MKLFSDYISAILAPINVIDEQLGIYEIPLVIKDGFLTPDIRHGITDPHYKAKSRLLLDSVLICEEWAKKRIKNKKSTKMLHPAIYFNTIADNKPYYGFYGLTLKNDVFFLQCYGFIKAEFSDNVRTEIGRPLTESSHGD